MYKLKSKRKRNDSFKSGPSVRKASDNRGRSGGKKKVSSIHPSELIRKPSNEVIVKQENTTLFEEMLIHPKLKANIAEKGFIHPTQIQKDTLEFLKAGRDLVGIADTGTGKTGAFLIPIIDRLLNNDQNFQTLVVVPTRELALQVEQEFKSLTRSLGLNAVSFIGGTNVQADLNKLRRNNHLIIGTPGRLMDLMDRRALRMDSVSVLILDEFDRMLDMGFVNDIKKIVGAMKSRKQTLLFSATIDKSQRSLIKQLLTDPAEVKAGSGVSASEQVDQDVIRVPMGSDKFDILLDMMNDSEFEKVLIFAETKRQVDKISKKLRQSGISSDLIHSNKSQNYRSKALDRFKSGNVKVLVATDVAARGIDVDNITHVINYQIPMNFDSYVHRIGRTGRAGKRGKALTFID